MKDKYLKYFFLLPGVVVVILSTIWPISQAIKVSFMEWKLSRSNNAIPLWTWDDWKTEGWSSLNYLFDNFNNGINDSLAWNAVKVTSIYTFFSVSITVIVAMGIALLLFKGGFFRNFARSILLLPFAMSPALVGVSWKFMFNPDFGILSAILEKIAFNVDKIDWLGDPTLALILVVASDVWHWSPYITLLLIGGLAGIPKDVREAALVDGAGRWHHFWNITFPLILPTLGVSIVLKMIFSLKMFDQVYMLTNGGPNNSTQTMAHYIYTQGFKYYDMGYASTLSYTLILPMLALTFLYIQLIFKKNPN